MKLFLVQLVNMQNALSILLQVQLPVRKAYTYKKFIQGVHSELKLYYEKRMDIIKQYGKNTDGDNYIIDTINVDNFNRDMMELGNIEVDLPDIELFTLEELNNLKLTTNDIIALEPILTNE